MSSDEEHSWMDEFHEQAQKEEMDRLRERCCGLEEAGREWSAKTKKLLEDVQFMKDSRDICLDEIKRLRSLLEKTQEGSGVSPPIEPPPEFRGDVVSSGGRNPQQQYSQERASGREEASVSRDYHETDQEKYARLPAPRDDSQRVPGPGEEQEQFQEMQGILLNNKAEARQYEPTNTAKQKKPQVDSACNPRDDESDKREPRTVVQHEIETPQGYRRATASDSDVFLRESPQWRESRNPEQPMRSYETPAYQHAPANYEQTYQSGDQCNPLIEQMMSELQTMKLEGRELRQMVLSQMSDCRPKETSSRVPVPKQESCITKRSNREKSDTESTEEDELPRSRGPRKLQRQDCMSGKKEFRSRMEPPQYKQITPELFNGDAPLQEYLGQFESVAMWNGWNDNQKAQQLFMSLRGRARGVIREQSEWRTITYQELVERLQTTFSGQAELYLAQLRCCQQQPQESLQDFSQSVRKLVDNAYVGMQEGARNRLARDHFMGNLRDKDIRSAVHLSRPTSLETAVQTALETEAFLAAEKQKLPTKFARSVEPQQKGVEEQLKEVIGLLKTVTEKAMINPESSEKSESTGKGQTPDSARSLNSGRRNGHGKRGRAWRRRDGGRPRACYGCGALDHFIANCPQPSNNLSREWYRQGNDIRPNQGAPEGSHVEERAPESQK